MPFSGAARVEGQQMSEQGLTGIVLAGGLSSRMGRDKASLPWDETDLLHTVLGTLAPICGEILVVGSIPRQIRISGVRTVVDQYSGCGPLGGIQAGLSAAANELCFVAACDMPFTDQASVIYLADQAADYDAVVAKTDGHYHPLYAVYRKSCLVPIESLLRTGRCRIIDFYPSIRLREVTAEEMTVFSPDLRMFRNLNSPEDFERFRKKADEHV